MATSLYRTLAIPIALVASLLALHTPVIQSALHLVFLSFIHELGHAIFYAVGARLCVPTPMFFTRCVTTTFTWEYYLLILLVLGYLAWRVRRSENHWLVRTVQILFFIELLTPVLFSSHLLNTMGVFGGFAGELIIGAAFVVLAHLDWPERESWKLERIVLLFWGMSSLVAGTNLWIKVLLGQRDLPYGSLMGALLGNSHPGGDLERLTEEFGFSPSTVLSLYLAVTFISVGVVLATYVITLIHQRKG